MTRSHISMSTDAGTTHTKFSSAGKIYTVGEVADAMRVSRMSIYRLIHTGSLQSLRVGSSFRVTQAALDAFLARADYTPTDGQ
jgi:excisionase family DNA binding protein